MRLLSTSTRKLSSARLALSKKPFTTATDPWPTFASKTHQSHFSVSKKHALISVVVDACEAIKFDETNVKGYYRRGQAQAALNQMQKAVESFKKVCIMQP